ncbi:hypothetical protein AO364_0917 [Moraxella catarrhalis]|nr:hypothetical protein AO364_0917 [Moraxella catarrhalis]
MPSLGKYFRCKCMIARFIGIFNISLRCGKKPHLKLCMLSQSNFK